MKLAEKLLDIAPSIGTALLGAPGGAIGAAARSVLKKVFGLDDVASDDEIEAQIASANPEMLLKLRQADNDFKVKMKEAEVDLEKARYADIDSARQREMAVGDYTNAILAFVILAAFFGVIVAMTFVSVPTDMKDAFLLLLGGLVVMAKQVADYYFGSSRGSKQKTAMLKQKE